MLDIRMPTRIYGQIREGFPPHRQRGCSEHDVIVTAGSQSDADEIHCLAKLKADDPDRVKWI